MDYTYHQKCRVCGNTKLTKYLDLGQMPLSNSLAESQDLAFFSKRYPLQVLFCDQCFLSQLSVVVDPEVMFTNYAYRSSVNGGYVKHCREMAKELKEKYHLGQNSFMVDIAGNDCALLNQFQEEIGLKVLNVDPAKNLVKICKDQGVPTVADFWGGSVASKILATDGHADLITATNVFAHVDDVGGFLRAAKTLLGPRGVLVLEFPYLIDFITNNEFDTIYFEHLSYFSVTPLVILCENVGLRVVEVEKQDIHGGSIRVTIGLPGFHHVTDSVGEYIDTEYKLGFNRVEKYLEWGQNVAKSAWKFKNSLMGLELKGAKIAGFAASAKGNTLLNYTSANYSHVNYIVDETPEKIGKFTPGVAIQVVDMNVLKESPPDYLIILSWNFKDEIIDKLKPFYKGKYIIPIPEFQII